MPIRATVGFVPCVSDQDGEDGAQLVAFEVGGFMISTGTASILAVDDTPANLDLLCSVLKERGYAVRPVPRTSYAAPPLRETSL